MIVCMCDELPRLAGGAYPAHWKPARVALSACTVHMKAIAKEDFHNYTCEYSFAKDAMVAEQQAPAFCEDPIALLGFAPVAVKVITCHVVKGVW